MILAIKEFIDAQKYPFTAIAVKSHLKLELNIDLSLLFIRKILKDELHYSFKRFSSKPTNIDLERLKKLRKIFAMKFNKCMNENTLVINVDESTINRSCKLNYSWSKKGQTSEFKNTIFQESLSVILAVSSDGKWLMGVKRNTINSDVFIQFMTNLDKWIHDNHKFGYNEVLITLDNCPCHFSKLTLIALSKLDLKVIFLCPYSPDFAPVEQWFSFIKRKLALKNKAKSVNLMKEFPLSLIYDTVKELKQSYIKNYFKKFNSVIKSFIK